MTTGDYLNAIKKTLEKKISIGEAIRDDEIQAYALVVIAQELHKRGV